MMMMMMVVGPTSDDSRCNERGKEEQPTYDRDHDEGEKVESDSSETCFQDESQREGAMDSDTAYLEEGMETKKRNSSSRSGTRDDDEDEENEVSRKISSLGSMMMPSSNIHGSGGLSSRGSASASPAAGGTKNAPSSCILDPLVSSPGIHKATIQRVTKVNQYHKS
jgi:hypothetical protein